MLQDPNEYTVTAGGNVYYRPKSSRPMVGMPDDSSAWRPVVPQLNLPAVDPRNFMELAVAELIAGSPSFDINSKRGDARRSRKGLSPADVQRLIEANPDFADDIRQMYLPGPSLPGIRKAEMGGGDMIAQDSVPVGVDSRLRMSQGEFQQIMRERMRNRVNPAPQQPYGNQLAEFLIRGA